MNNSMATPVATTTSSGKTARSSPDSVLDFMGTPPLPEENDVETDISSDVPVYGHHPHQQHNSAAAVDSWAPVQPLTGRRRLGAAHNRGSGGASGSGPSLNLLSSSIGPGLVRFDAQFFLFSTANTCQEGIVLARDLRTE